jgi:hypothetical protein
MLAVTRNRTINIRRPIIVILLICLTLMGCEEIASKTTISPSDTISIPKAGVTPNELPGYLTAVWPMTSSITKVNEYSQRVNNTLQGGVGVRLRVDRVYPLFIGEEFGKIEYSDENTIDPKEHMELIIDGENISQELIHANALDAITVHDQTGMLLYSGVAQMDVFWSVPLQSGEHVSLLRISNRNQEIILEYEWSFILSK